MFVPPRPHYSAVTSYFALSVVFLGLSVITNLILTDISHLRANRLNCGHSTNLAARCACPPLAPQCQLISLPPQVVVLVECVLILSFHMSWVENDESQFGLP